MTTRFAAAVGRAVTLALAALLLGSTSGSSQAVAGGDSAAVAATAHGRVELDVRRGTTGDTVQTGMRVALDARVAARMGMAAGAATIAVILGAGGLAGRRRRDRRGGAR